YQSPDEVIAEVLHATAIHNPGLRGITLSHLLANGAVPMGIASEVPFGDGQFPTPSGKVELYSQALADQGVDPLPGSFDEQGDEGCCEGRWDPAGALHLLTPASHHFVTSSLASQPGLLRSAGTPLVEIHPSDAAARGIRAGDPVIVENGRGWCRLR